MLKLISTIIRWLTPPIFIILINKFRQPTLGHNILFDGDDSLFKKALEGVNLYGEYGVGNSTNWVLNNTNANVLAVDTCKFWVDKIIADNKLNNDRLAIKYVDLGETEAWGRPINFARHHLFDEYTDWIWKQPEKPTCILVDGRFRVCCFLSTLKYAEENTLIIFDDYTDRPHYHLIEKYVDKIEVCGRQCLFIVPPREKIDFDELDKDIVNFRYVMD